jgi:hypothetical protein
MEAVMKPKHSSINIATSEGEVMMLLERRIGEGYADIK